jgi:hypothetical protein
MYDFLDRPVTSLDHGGRFLVWSTRSWVGALSERKCPAGAIAAGFEQWNMLKGLQPFLRMMALFNRHGLENFQFCALQCNHVSEHEAIIISLVCALRDEASCVALRQTLDLLVEAEAVGDVILSLADLGNAMAAAGIHPVRPIPDHSPRANGTKASGA